MSEQKQATQSPEPATIKLNTEKQKGDVCSKCKHFRTKVDETYCGRFPPVVFWNPAEGEAEAKFPGTESDMPACGEFSKG